MPSVEATVSGVKTVVFNTPKQFDVILYPLLVEDDRSDPNSSFKICGSQLLMFVPAIEDSDNTYT